MAVHLAVLRHKKSVVAAGGDDRLVGGFEITDKTVGRFRILNSYCPHRAVGLCAQGLYVPPNDTMADFTPFAFRASITKSEA
jgi:hypothetical protein